MDDYRFASQQDDGSWELLDIRCADDDDAVDYGLRSRTANECELYHGDQLLATFDGVSPCLSRGEVGTRSNFIPWQGSSNGDGVGLLPA